MTTKIKRAEGLFKERVLPYFPKTEERFKRYFKSSYEFMRSLPLNGYYRRNNLIDIFIRKLSQGCCLKRKLLKIGTYPKPIWSREYLQTKARKLIYLGSSLEVNFTALGIKPMTYTGTNNPLCFYLKKHGEQSLKEVGLKAIKEYDGSFYVYDPLIVAAVLSPILNRRIKVENAGEAIEEVFKSFSIIPNELYGYPEMLRGNAAANKGLSFSVSSKGVIHGIPYETPKFICVVYTPEIIIPTFESWANAAALIEEVLDSGPTTSMAALHPPSNTYCDPRGRILVKDIPILANLSIERNSPSSEWKIDRDISLSSSEYGSYLGFL